MHSFDLFLFSTDPDFIRPAVAAGVTGIVVDWEHIGKAARQAGADTQINHDTVDDLLRVRACTDVRIICRVNGCGVTTREEVELALAAGADEILLPMVRGVQEVRAVLDHVDDRCEVGILVETAAALGITEPLAALPLSRVYVGLNDLALERKTRNIFTAMIDGTVERIRRPFRIPFGFAGLTVPDRGFPIPCRLIIGELIRLGCHFSFLRRSFCRDIPVRDLAIQVPRIHDALTQAGFRSPEVIAQDRQELVSAVLNWPTPLHISGTVGVHESPLR